MSYHKSTIIILTWLISISIKSLHLKIGTISIKLEIDNVK